MEGKPKQPPVAANSETDPPLGQLASLFFFSPTFSENVKPRRDLILVDRGNNEKPVFGDIFTGR
jgi:hypothetical protein